MSMGVINDRGDALTGADPGFAVGGGRQPSLEGAPTSDTGAFQ